MSALEGIRVLDLCRLSAGGLASMHLGDMGADVIKIEEPLRAPPGANTRERLFSMSNRNKRSISINLKTSDGVEVFHRLARTADVIMEGFRPGVVDRLGVGYSAVKSYNERIVYCSLSGYGQDGPDRDHPGHDINYLARAGVLGLVGRADETPVAPLNLVADYGGASMHAALGIMVALFARERSGFGQFIDISYLDTTLALLGASPAMKQVWSDEHVPLRGRGTYGGEYPYYSVYRTRDGRYLSVGCHEKQIWRKFLALIGRPDLEEYGATPLSNIVPATADALRARDAVASIIETDTSDAWMAKFSQANVAVEMVSYPNELADDPQIRYRGMIYEEEVSDVGTVRQVGLSIRLSETPGTIRSLGPATGEQTEEILEELGYSSPEVKALRASDSVT